LEGNRKNDEIIRKIRENINIKIETGGGIRSSPEIERILGLGVDYVVLGTSAINNEKFLSMALEKFPEKIILSIDSKDGFVVKSGWTENTNLKTLEFIKKVEEMGVNTIVLTDTLKDGTLSGVNLNLIMDICNKTSMEVIVAGGVSSLEDIINIKNLNNKKIKGIIIGKAYYEGKIDIKKAIEVTK